MKHTILLLITILISSCGTVQTKEDISNDKNLSQVEKDIATCELGQDLYKKCTPYSGFRSYETYDNWDYGKSYKDNYKDGYFPMYSEEWIDECPSGETKVWLNLFGAKTYVRHQDIKECMNDKGYTYKNTVWLKSKNTKTPVIQHLKKTKKISKYSTNTHKENTERDQVASKKHNSIADINNLKKIKDLLDSGVINKQEFNTMKAKIIKGM